MNKHTAILAAALLLPLAAAAQQGPYLSVHAGVNDLRGWDHRIDFGGIAMDGRLSLDSSWHWGVSGGRHMGPVRAEVEFEQGRFDVTNVELGPVSEPRDGRGTYSALMLNGYGVLELQSNVALFAGAGAGYGWVKVPALAPLAGCDCYRKATGSGFAWQLRAGVEYKFSDAGRLFAQYTYLRLPGAGTTPAPFVSYGRKDVNVIELGYAKPF